MITPITIRMGADQNHADTAGFSHPVEVTWHGCGDQPRIQSSAETGIEVDEGKPGRCVEIPAT